MKVGKILATENQYGQNRLNLKEGFEEELLNDTWDARLIGIPFPITRPDYYLSFTLIPTPFRQLVKRYVRARLIDTDSVRWLTVKQDVYKLNVFFNWIHTNYPDCTDLCNISRQVVEQYFLHLRRNPMGGKSPSQYRDQDPSDYYIWCMVANLENFLTFIQRYDWPDAPHKPIRSIIFQEDRPKLKPKNIDEYDYLSDNVWQQILINLPQLDSQYSPMVYLMEATGLHLIDILHLKTDCLIETEQGIWIRSHRYKLISIPIIDKIGELVKAQILLINKLFPSTTNTPQFLFLKYKGKSSFIGKPYLQPSVLRQLNIFAKEFGIKNENGVIFRFQSRLFRHRFGVNKINSGISIVDVQKLTANVTPIMAVNYAKINDLTKLRRLEQNSSLDAIRLDAVTGNVVRTELLDLAHENGVTIDTLQFSMDEMRLEHGYCIKSPKTICQYLNQMLEQPCITFKCSSFYVDSTFKDYYEEQIKVINERIIENRKQGRTRAAELLEPKLEKYKMIYFMIK